MEPPATFYLAIPFGQHGLSAWRSLLGHRYLEISEQELAELPEGCSAQEIYESMIATRELIESVDATGAEFLQVSIPRRSKGALGLGRSITFETSPRFAPASPPAPHTRHHVAPYATEQYARSCRPGRDSERLLQLTRQKMDVLTKDGVLSEPQRRFIEQSLEQKGSSPSVL